jgi:predicted kinase
VPFLILACSAPPEVLRQRILDRQAAGGDPSEAGIAVLEAQLESREPPAEDEQADVVMPAPEDTESAAALAERIAARIR